MGLEYDKKQIEKDLRYKYIPYDSIFNLIQIGASNIDNIEMIPINPPFAQTQWMALTTHCTYTSNEFNVYLGTLVTDTLGEINTQTHLPTGNIKNNVFGDQDYIPPILNPTTCPTYQTEWIPDEESATCELSEGENTGYKIYTLLRERIIGTTTLTGQTKSNTIGSADYIPPVQDSTTCPVTIEVPPTVYPFKWITSGVYCLTESDINTGYKGYTTLLKVVDGGFHDNEPLDINANLCADTSLPQDSKPNTLGDPNYVAPILDETTCPVPEIFTPKWVIDESASYCEIEFTPDETGIVVADIYGAPSNTEIYAKINTPGVAENSLVVHTGNNFAPIELAANPAQCLMLASDYVAASGSLKWRFEFNIAKLMAFYPMINVFVLEIRGIVAGGYSSGGAHSLKGADAGNMTMTGSVGSYIPSTVGAPGIGIIMGSFPISSGTPDYTYADKPLVCTFTYDRISKVLTKS